MFPSLVAGPLMYSIAIAAVTAIVMKIVFTAFYNRYLHRLSNFPGPALCGVFEFPNVLASLRGTQYLHIQALHEKYGHVVRVAPGSLSYTASQAWRDIYALKPDRSELLKDPAYYGVDEASQFLNASPAEHHRLRKAVGSFLTESSILEHEPLLMSYFGLFITKLRQQVAGPAYGRVDLMVYFNLISYDIIGELVLGKSFNALETGEYHAWMRSVESITLEFGQGLALGTIIVPNMIPIRNVFEAIKFLGVIRLGDTYPIIGMLFNWVERLVPSIAAQARAHDHFIEEKVDQRLRLMGEGKDLISQIYRNTRAEEVRITTKEIVTICDLFLIAGSETTATHLTGAVWLLLSHPEKFRRAQIEVRSSFQTADKITLRAVGQTDRLPFLNAVIKETFRCYPSIPTNLPRITGREGNVIAGRWVPPRTSVGVHHWSAYRQSKNFNRPDEFIPERWLPDAHPCFATDDVEVLQPFQVGPRACMGRSLAYHEIRSLLVHLLWNFEMDLEPESANWMENQKESAIWDKPSLWVRLSEKRMG